MAIEATGNIAKTITIDKIFITGFRVQTYPPGKEFLIIDYAGGYYDVDNNFVIVESRKITLNGAEFGAIAAMTPDTSSGLFTALEQILIDEVNKDIAI